MLLNPQQIVDKQIVKGTVSVQPNAIDFTVDSINEIEATLAYLSNDKSLVQHASQLSVELTDAVDLKSTYGILHPERELEKGQVLGWWLHPNREYDVTSNVYVEVPDGTAAFLVSRSTFTRNGISLSSGLYDSGFKGNIGFVIKTGNTPVYIEQGTFIGQIYFTESQSVGEYAGSYNTKDGQHWADAVATKELKAKAKVEPKQEAKVEAEPSKIAIKAEVEQTKK
jgi:deoxycytidine triphosphate deaminase